MTATQFLHKLTFQPPFRQIKAAWFHRAAALRQKRWRRWHETQRSCQVHPSLEIREDVLVTVENLSLGAHTVLERDITLWLGASPRARITLGARVYIGRNSYLGALEPLVIGDDTLIGAYSYLITANHKFADPAVPVREQGYHTQPITIGRDVWIGAHVVVLPGAAIGDRAVVGAGAVVTKPVPTGEIWAGVPARKIGERGRA